MAISESSSSRPSHSPTMATEHLIISETELRWSQSSASTLEILIPFHFPFNSVLLLLDTDRVWMRKDIEGNRKCPCVLQKEFYFHAKEFGGKCCIFVCDKNKNQQIKVQAFH